MFLSSLSSKRFLCIKRCLLFQEILFCILHTLEVEVRESLLHKCLNPVVAEIADTSFMGMMDILVWLEFTSFNLQSHCLVGISEWHSVSGKLIYFLNREHRIITRIIEDVLVNLHLVDDVSSHLQTVFQLVESWEEYFLDNLKITEITQTYSS